MSAIARKHVAKSSKDGVEKVVLWLVSAGPAAKGSEGVNIM